MNATTLVLCEIALPLLFGGGVFAWLQPVTRRLLVDLCGSGERADFWVRISGVLIVAAPTALVLAFGGSPGGDGLAVTETLRHAFALAVFGIVIAVGVIARSIRNSIPAAAPASSQGAQPCVS